MFSLYGIPLSIYLIAATVCLLFVGSPRVWIISLFVTLVTAFIDGGLEVSALVPLGLLAVLLHLFQTHKKFDWAILILSIFLGLLFGLHVLPGFNNIQYLESAQLSANSATFDLWFNYDKALFGILVLAIVLRPSLNRSFADWRIMSVTMLPIFSIGLAATFGVGLLLGYSHFQLDLEILFWPWVFKNLFFTVIAEEALFRGLIQRHLTKHLSGVASVAIAAGLFGVAHFAGGWQYVLLSSLAGFMYGYCYLKTARIEAAILAHLLLNVVHFVFFAYPNVI